MPKFEREICRKASETASFLVDRICDSGSIRLVDSSVYRAGGVMAYMIVFDCVGGGMAHITLSIMIVGSAERCTVTAIASGGGIRLDSEADAVALVEQLIGEYAGDI